MNILTFNEYINEQLWSKGIERSKTNKKRIGDLSEFDKYIKNIYWVDLNHPDILFAEIDFDEGLSINDILNLTLPNNIKDMDYDIYKWITHNCKKSYINSKEEHLNFSKYECYKCEDNGEYTCFNIDFTQDYFLNFNDTSKTDDISYNTLLSDKPHKCRRTGDRLNSKNFTIKLIKYK